MSSGIPPSEGWLPVGPELPPDPVKEMLAQNTENPFRNKANEEQDYSNALDDTKGCAILDSGATLMCSSTVVAEEIQEQRLRHNEPGEPSVQDSDRRFRFVDGRTDGAAKMVDLLVTAGLLEGQTITMHFIDRVGNDTSPLFSIDDQRRVRMVVDYEDNIVMFKDKLGIWHKLPTTEKKD